MLLAAALAPWRPTRLVSSLEAKARETARITGGLLNRPVTAAAGLEEQDRRGVGFLAPAAFHAGITALLTQPGRRVFGRETGQEAADRFRAALTAVAPPTATIAIVTHGSVLTLYLAGLGLVDPLPFWQGLGQPALIVLRWPTPTLLQVRPHLDTVSFIAGQEYRLRS